MLNIRQIKFPKINYNLISKIILFMRLDIYNWPLFLKNLKKWAQKLKMI